MEEINKEIDLMKILNGIDSKNIIKIENWLYEEKEQIFTIQMENANCNLFEIIKARKTKNIQYDVFQAIGIMENIMVGVLEAQTRKICHRDLKPGNILVSDKLDQEDILYKVGD